MQHWATIFIWVPAAIKLIDRAIGHALRHLPDHGQEKYGYHPLLAETSNPAA